MTESHLPDGTEDLVLRAQLGDQEAYAQLVKNFQDMALAYAHSVLGDFDLAEDARQEAFVSAYFNLMALREPAAFSSWLRTIVRRVSLNMVRGKHVLTVPLDEATVQVPSDAPGPFKLAEKAQSREIVGKAIVGLPDAERKVVQFYYLEDRPLREISGITGVPVKTIKSRLHTARARLRQEVMKRVKDSATKQDTSDGKRAVQEATAEAIPQLDAEARGLLRFPTPEDLGKGGDLLRAKGRMERFAGKNEDAISTFEEAMLIPGLKGDALFRARMRAEIGLTCVQMSDYARAKTEFRASRTSLKRRRDRSGLLAAVLNGLGMCFWSEGNFRKARDLYEESLEVSHTKKCAAFEAEARNNLALLDWKQGCYRQALSGLRTSLRHWKKMNHSFWWPVTLMNIAIIEENLGRYPAARGHYREALSKASSTGFPQLQAAVEANLANLDLAQRRWASAARHSELAIEWARKAGDRRLEAAALENLALADTQRRESPLARNALRDARRIAKSIGDEERLVSLELAKAEELLSRKKVKQAAAVLDATGAVVEHQGYVSEIPRLLRLRAEAEILAGEKASARKALTAARRACRKQENRTEESRVSRLLKNLETMT